MATDVGARLGRHSFTTMPTAVLRRAQLAAPAVSNAVLVGPVPNSYGECRAGGRGAGPTAQRPRLAISGLLPLTTGAVPPVGSAFGQERLNDHEPTSAVAAVSVGPAVNDHGETVLDEYLAFARELALAAGHIIRQGFDETHKVAHKADGSPVTDIDIQVNQIVLEQIRSHYPGHGLLGEERNFGTGFESYRWICDPLDGTVPYILGLPNSLFMLALMGEPGLLIAVAYDPFANRLYHAAKDGGAFCNSSPIHVSGHGLSDGYVLLGTDSLSFANAIRQADGRIGMVSGSGYKSMMVARGKAVALIKETADFHDIAPAALIVTEAGGQVTALDGSPLILDRHIDGGVIISNGLAHPALVKVAQG